ncbi:hypothetical protein HYH03_000036 [Edaphochlamys debaryana]|uniref:Uncharacterized protein n=1 Tax=Edaphochlamys debaryana TaxID=47281 RepID=A0A835YPL3_9CHLO|nr:hypothetical protein HYH03_000036 [Edaphochlamys debaryana]|eukprot:KAG2501529.1 hypothetical protein HYH03_000036 [Edaphochlamys debaryana]
MCGGGYGSSPLPAPTNSSSSGSAGSLLLWREGGGQTLAVTLRLHCNWMLVPNTPVMLTVQYGSGLTRSATWSNSTARATCVSFQAYYLLDVNAVAGVTCLANGTSYSSTATGSLPTAAVPSATVAV